MPGTHTHKVYLFIPTTVVDESSKRALSLHQTAVPHHPPKVSVPNSPPSAPKKASHCTSNLAPGARLSHTTYQASTKLLSLVTRPTTACTLCAANHGLHTPMVLHINATRQQAVRPKAHLSNTSAIRNTHSTCWLLLPGKPLSSTCIKAGALRCQAPPL